MIQDLSVALRALPTPEAEPHLRQRILAARAGGKRVQLPKGGRIVRTRFLVAAAMVALVAIADWTRHERGRQADDTRDVYAALLGGAPWWPNVSAARETRTALAAPRYPQIVQFDPSRVVGGTWVYEGRTTTDGILTGTTGQLTITASPVHLAGMPAWLVTTTRGTGAYSLLVSRTTLRPLRYRISGSHGRTHVVQRYTRDSVHETIDVSRPTERHLRKAVPLPGGREAPLLTLTPYEIELGVLAQALPLQEAWRGSVYIVQLVSPGGPIPPFVPVDLRVTGRDRVTVPAGTFDCWKVEAIRRYTDGDSPSILWVSRDRHFVIKTEYRGGDFVTQRLLASYTTLDTGDSR